MKKHFKGSVVVESAIYLPFVFISMLVIFMYASMLYQQVVLQSVSQQVANFCSMQLRDPGFKSLLENNEYSDITILDYSRNHPYRYLFKNDLNEKALVNIAKQLVDKSVIGNTSNLKIKIKQSNYFITNSYSVLISQQFNSPIDLSLLGLPKNFEIKEQTVIRVVDQAEFIRNSDLAFELVKKIDNKLKVTDTINKMIKAAKGFLANEK